MDFDEIKETTSKLAILIKSKKGFIQNKVGIVF